MDSIIDCKVTKKGVNHQIFLADFFKNDYQLLRDNAPKGQ